MKKFYARVAALFVLNLLLFTFCPVRVSAQTPQYFKGLGTGTNTIPMNNPGSHCQQIYLPGDFNITPIPGLITKIYFRNSVASASGTYTNFSVAFLQNSLSAFPDNNFLTGFTTALFSPSITINGNATAGGWYEIPLTTPFLYNNSQTLIVEIKYDVRAAGGMSGYTTSAGVGINKRLSIIVAPGAPTGNLSSIWGDFGMDVLPASACTSPPAPGTSTATPATPICSGTSVQLNLAGQSLGTGQTYIWQSSALLAGPYTGISASSSFSNHTVNPTSTTFYRAAVTCGAETRFSVPVEVQVTPAFPGGTYTINPLLPAGAGNYQSFATAISALNCGIAGPVVFNVNAAGGPYNEQVLIPQVGGVSSINTITFNGNGAIIQATPVTGTRYLVRLDGADYIRLNNLNLLALPGSTFGWGVHFTNGANNNIVNACTIDVSAVTSTTQSNSAGIVGSGSATSVVTDGDANNNTISNNTITGGYQGIIMSGAAGSLDALNNSILNNEIKDFLITGIELVDHVGALVEGNNIHRTNRTDIGTTVSQGIELGAGNLNCVVKGNRIHDSHTSAITQSGTFYGIISNANDASAGFENRIINNLVYKLNSLTGTQYGLYNTGSDGVLYYHNTVILDHAASTAGLTRGFYQLTLASNIQFRNNLVYINRGGTGVKYAVYFGTITSTIISNNNELYNIATGGTNGIGSFGTTGYATLALWQGANGNAYDQNSVSVNPLFLNAAGGDYTPMSLQVDGQGAPLGVTTDINNNPRNAITPDPGAFEFNVAAGINMGATALVIPASGGSGCYTSAQTITIRIRNSSLSTINFATNPVTVTTNVTGTVVQTLAALVNTGTLASNATLDVPMSTTLNMSATGTYTFDAFTSVAGDVLPANDAMPTETRTKLVLTAGVASATPGAICITPISPTLNATGANGYGSVQWQQSTTSGSGFTNIPGGTTIPFTVAAPISQTMYYRLIVGCDAGSLTSNEVTVTFNNPMVTGTTPAAICGTGTASLSATGTGNTTFNWYNAPVGGAPLGTGSPFTTPAISSTTTFYVSATTGGVSTNTGLPAQIAATPGFGTTNFGIVFDVTAQFTLNSVTIYPMATAANTPGTVTIDVINSSGVIVHTATVNVIGNPTPTSFVAPLNFVINPGTNYKIRPGSRSASITSLLFEPSATSPPGGYGYPYIVPGVLTILHSTLGAAPGNTPRLDLYYYFYNWSVSTGCESARTPVVATVDPAPAATLSYAGSPYCSNAGTANITFSGTTGGTYSSTGRTFHQCIHRCSEPRRQHPGNIYGNVYSPGFRSMRPGNVHNPYNYYSSTVSNDQLYRNAVLCRCRNCKCYKNGNRWWCV